MGINLVVQIEMQDVLSVGSGAGPIDRLESLLGLDSSLYDGATYFFEVIGKATTGMGTFTLRDRTNVADKVSVTTTSTTPVRLRSASWTPASGLIEYVLRTTNAIASASRIIIEQVNATKTAIYLPLGWHELAILSTAFVESSTYAKNKRKYWHSNLYNNNGGLTSVTFEATFRINPVV